MDKLPKHVMPFWEMPEEIPSKYKIYLQYKDSVAYIFLTDDNIFYSEIPSPTYSMVLSPINDTEYTST